MVQITVSHRYFIRLLELFFNNFEICLKDVIEITHGVTFYNLIFFQINNLKINLYINEEFFL